MYLDRSRVSRCTYCVDCVVSIFMRAEKGKEYGRTKAEEHLSTSNRVYLGNMILLKYDCVLFVVGGVTNVSKTDVWKNEVIPK